MRTDAPFDAAGSLREAYAAVDWAATPLGPVDAWSPTLLGTVDLMLHTRFPITLCWGPEFVMVYNEAYVPLIGAKHPGALGSAAPAVFPEAWPVLGPMMQSVRAGAGPTWVEDALVALDRRGFLEECYFTFSYSPVRDPAGAVEGVLDIAAETTRQVIDRRRLALLAQLNERLADVEDVAQIAARARPLLAASGAADLPAAAIGLPGVTAGERDPRLPPAPITPLPAAGSGTLTLEETDAGRVAWLALAAAPDAHLAVLLSPHLDVDDGYVDFLGLIASSLSQALDRVAGRAAERAVGEAERTLSETLQRSMLTEPPRLDRLPVAVRYQAAAREARVGGDWYDAFRSADGALTLVVGDVAGHDRHAAAAMAQLRNLLRGVSSTQDGSPAGVLGALDVAMRQLGLDVFATAIVAQVRPDGDGWRLTWANAGHPFPVLLGPDGSTRLLAAPHPDPLLGLARRDRRDHEIAIAPGSSFVLYTDGLVERRNASLADGLAWLTGILEGRQDLDPEAVCDHVIEALGGTVEDDIALLVLKAG